MRVVRYIVVLLFAIIALAISATESPLAIAQSKEPAVIAIVEVQSVMREAIAAQSIQAQVEAKRGQYQAEISAEEGRLRDLEQELARQRSVLSPEAYAKRRREFEGDVAAVQRIVVDRRRELDQAYGAGVRQLQVEISKIIAEIAAERGITIVLPEAQTLFVDNSTRISREVLSRLDERMPDLTLEFGPN